jgi:hypothetical protein
MRAAYAYYGDIPLPRGERYLALAERGEQMDFESEIRRRVTLIEKEVEGEKGVSRHILKKVNENEGLLLDLSKKVANIEDQLTLLRADMPGIIAQVVGALLREERERK